MGISATIDEVTLERFQMIAVQDIATEFATEFAEKPDIEFEWFSKWTKDSILMRLKQPIWGEEYIGPTIEYPANWKEAVKERFAPAWFKRRWPVEKTVKCFKAKILYPLISFPREKHWFSVDAADGASGDYG